SWLLAGRSKPTDFSLDEGKWMFVMAGGEGIQALTGYTLEFISDTVLDYGAAESVSGTTTGNVLTDNDPQFGYDELPEGTTVTSINGIAISSNAKTVINGEHGKLIIEANGDYTYEVSEDFRGPYGSEDVFSYEVTSPAGNTASADLTIKLNITPDDQQLQLDSTVVVDIEPTITLDTDESGIKNAGAFGVLDLGLLGPVLSADLIGAEGTMNFTVKEGQVRKLSFQGEGGSLLSLATSFDLVIFKLNEQTGQLEEVHKAKKWFEIPFDLIGIGGAVMPKGEATLEFTEGTYVAMLQGKSAVGLVGGSTLSVTHDTIYDYNLPSKFMGEVTGDATEEADVVLLKVNDEPLEAGTATTVQGEYV